MPELSESESGIPLGTPLCGRAHRIRASEREHTMCDPADEPAEDHCRQQASHTASFLGPPAKYTALCPCVKMPYGIMSYHGAVRHGADGAVPYGIVPEVR